MAVGPADSGIVPGFRINPAQGQGFTDDPETGLCHEEGKTAAER